MAAITAAMVNELRAKTGQAMMKCKQVLTEAGGDIDKAIDIFRKQGVKASLAERAATEGRVVGVVAADGKAGALVEINCNTDFTAKSEPVMRSAPRPPRRCCTIPASTSPPSERSTPTPPRSRSRPARTSASARPPASRAPPAASDCTSTASPGRSAC